MYSVRFGFVFVLALCLLTQAPLRAQALTAEQRAQLQSQLSDLEAQIAQQQKILDAKQKQGVSLQRDIDILNAQIKQSQLSIKARDLAIQQLNQGIQTKASDLHGLNKQLTAELESLAAIMREKNELDTSSLVVAALSSQSLSAFFADLSTFDQITAKMQESFKVIQNTQTKTQKEKDELEKQREEENQLRQVQALQKKQIEAQQAQEKKILAETKGQEKAYQEIIAQTQKSAAQIRAALFELSGSAAIPFSKALEYANLASKETGVRPAFLLGIIAEESNLGENVGKGTYLVDMHPTRDVPVFKALTAALGLVPENMPVSKKVWYGYGGAMGPAQFIPSTWVLYAGYVETPKGSGNWEYVQSKDRVGKRTGNTPPNPWNPQDAFMAAALYLTDNGADKQTASAEFKAAMCYLAGCGNANKASLQFYGQDVAKLARKYQCQIDVLNGNMNSSNC